jgi:hypothetical protein
MWYSAIIGPLFGGVSVGEGLLLLYVVHRKNLEHARPGIHA